MQRTKTSLFLKHKWIARAVIISVAAATLWVTVVLGQPPAPVPLLPISGSRVVIPSFSWMGSTGADHYEVQIGPQSDPVSVYWHDITNNLNLTPNDAANLPNEPLYWQVRAFDAANSPGPWCNPVNFTKYIPGPELLNPHNHLALVQPDLEWSPVEGAAYYKVELSQSASFVPVDYTYTTYSSSLTPNDAIASGTYFWRVRGVDAHAHEGDNSPVWSFVKQIPAPLVTGPPDGIIAATPHLEWQAAAGAVSYKVEFSTSTTFVPVTYSYTTYNTRLAPTAALAMGTYSWRVRGVDANGGEGSNSAVRMYVHQIEAPQLVSPADGSSITQPTLAWMAVDGAARYRIEISIVASFNTVVFNDITYNTRLVPTTNLAPGVYYWRLRGLDAVGHEGTPSVGRSFTINSPPVPSDTTPQLQYPADAEALTTDPLFAWTRVSGAASYRLIVSASPTFASTYDNVITSYTGYSPYTPGAKYAYINGTYYWKVEARNSIGSVISTSPARIFTKQQTFTLSTPEDSLTLTLDPFFKWERMVGAKTYRLIVSTSPTFNTTYDSVISDYTAYVPFTMGTHDIYKDQTYYWKVEARDHSGAVIATSAAHSFTKQSTLTLYAPLSGGTIVEDPLYRWSALVGANTYRVQISTSPTFASAYDSVITNYTAYTPFTPGTRNAYSNGTYYWRVEARDFTGAVIITSPVATFTRAESVLLFKPPNAVVLGNTPTFEWGPVLGAKTYYLQVSTNPAFSSTYDSVISDYTRYTPYTPGLRSTYAPGIYYWRVEARESTGTGITTSLAQVFTISSGQPTSTPIGQSTNTPSPSPTITPSPTPTLSPTATPTPLGNLPPDLPPPSGQMQVGNVYIYANTFTDLGQNRWNAAGNVMLGSAARKQFELRIGEVTLDLGANSIQGSADSDVAMRMADHSSQVLFTGPFSVDPNTGLLSTTGNVSFRIDRLGDLSIDLASPVTGFSANVLQGTASGEVTIEVYSIEGDLPSARVSFHLSYTGQISGDIGVGGLEFDAAALTFSVESATLNFDPATGGSIHIAHASVSLPPDLDVGAEGWVEDVTIDHNGLDVGGGGISITLPEMKIPGAGDKFEIAGAEVTLELGTGGHYKVTGQADFSLPNITTRANPGTTYTGGVYAEFELDETGLRYVLVGGTVDPGIPIGNTGFVLTGLEGRVDLPAVRIQITGTIETAVEVPPLGPLVSGDPSLWVQFEPSFGMGIQGSVKVLIFDAAQASLEISEARGVEGSVHVEYIPYLLSGDGSIHVWRSGGVFHFTGSATVTLGFNKGAWYQKETTICLPIVGCGTVGIYIPPVTFHAAQVGIQIGEFCEDGSCNDTVYGVKGTASALDGWWEESFFINTYGDLSYGDDATQYALFDQGSGLLSRAAELKIEAPYADVYTVPVGTTDQAIFMLAWKKGAPTFKLYDPKGDPVLPGPTVYFTQVVTSSYIIVNDPRQGAWQAEVGNLNGDEFYLLNVLGSNVPPTVTLTSAIPSDASHFTIHWTATDPDDQPTLALYYDMDDLGADGTLIAQGLNPAAGSYTWDASQVKTGAYHLYARIDDLRNAPVVSYATGTVTVVNSGPPAIPTGLQVTVAAAGNSLRACWNRSPESDVTGYNVYFGTLPGVFDLMWLDAGNVTCADLPLPKWANVSYLAISAYDNSGNESSLTAYIEVRFDHRKQLYLPLALRK